MLTDEFEIKATKHPKEADRIWTRSTLHVAQFIADSAARLGYGHVEVVNTFGGVRSDPLYVVDGKTTHSPLD